MSEKIVQLNEEVIKGQIKELVRGSVEETLNELLEKEAESLTQAARYERSEARQGYRSGHYDRNLTTTSGDVTLHMPRLKGVSFETAIIERYRRRESSVEEALIEMYLAGVSVRRVEDITEALWGSKVSPATISELNKKAYVHIEDWRNRPLQGGRYPYVYVDGIYLRRNWGGEYENVAVLVAIAVNEDGFREVLGAAEGMKEDKASWVSFFQWLCGRGLEGIKLSLVGKTLRIDEIGKDPGRFGRRAYDKCGLFFILVGLTEVLTECLELLHAVRDGDEGLRSVLVLDDLENFFSAHIVAGTVVAVNARHLEAFRDVLLGRAVKYGGHYLPAELSRGKSEVDLKDLTDIHSGRNAQRVQHDFKRRTIR